MPTVGGLVVEVAANVARLQKDVDAIRGHFGRLQDVYKDHAKTSQGVFEQIKDGWVGVASKIYAVGSAIEYLQKAGEYITIGAKAQQSAESFTVVAKTFGENAEEIVSAMKRASAGTVDESDIMQKAVKGMVQGLSGNQMVKIMEAARISARVSGEDVKIAYETITDAIANKLPRALVRYGLITKEQVNILNKSIADGNTDIDLYALAMANAAKQSAAFGSIASNTAEELQKLNAIITEIKEDIGIGLYRVINGIGLALVDTAKMMTAPFALMEKGLNKLGISGSLWQNTFEEQSTLAEKWQNGMMGVSDAAKNTGGNVAEANKKIKATMDALKQQDTLKKSAEDAKKFGEEYAKAMEGLTRKMSLIDMNQFDKQRQEVENEVYDLRKKFGDEPLITEYFDMKMASIQGEQVLKKYEEIFKSTKEYTIKTIEEEQKAMHSRLKYLNEYRDALVSTYDYATNKAQEYYKTSSDLSEKIAHGKEFLSNFNAQPNDIADQMAKEKRAIAEMMKGEGINIFDTTNTVKTMDAIEKFLEKYKGAQDVLGFDISFSGVKKDYDDLISKLEVAKNKTEQSGNAWTEFANQQATAIQSVDGWIVYIQGQISALDTQISTARAITVDTSAATANVQNLISQIQYLNSMSISAATQTVTYGGGTVANEFGDVSIPYIESPFQPVSFEPAVGYATGTDYVPKTGMYQLHQGEAVIPANQNSQTNNFNPTIIVQGNNGSSIAKDIDRELAKMWKYNRSELRKVMA